MEFSQSVIDKRVEVFLGACKKTKTKVTPQRSEIFKALAATDEHPGVEDIYNRIRIAMPNVSKDTVYRTLALFEKIGVAIKVEQLCEKVRYDADTAEHQHFLCVECGEISDFYYSGVKSLFGEEILSEVGEVHSVALQLRGVCKECCKKNHK